MNKILYLTLVKEYYRQNAIFIFAVMMFAFGFLRAIEHLSIIREALRSPFILFLFSAGWILHGVKVTLFVIRTLSLRNHEFLYQLILFSPAKRFVAFLWMQFCLIQLTFFYSLVMMVIAYRGDQWNSLVIIAAVNVLIVVIGGILYELKIRKPNSQQNSVRKFFKTSFTMPAFLFFPGYLIRHQTILFFITKCFTAFILMGVCYLYPTDDYDIRLLSLATLLAVFSQSVILQQLHVFEKQYFRFVRNLPLSVWRRFRSYVFTLSVVLIPEAVVLVRNLPRELNLADWFLQMVFLLSVTFALMNFQLFRIRDDEKGFQVIFFSGIFLAILIMFKIPVTVFSAGGMLAGYFLLWKYYYSAD